MDRLLSPAGDLGLIAIAVAVADGPVRERLAARPDQLFAVCGVLHIIVMPLVFNLLLSPWVGASQLMLSNERTPVDRVLVWSSVLYLCCSFIVPGVLGMGLRVSLPWSMAVIFGPYVALFLVTWVLLRLDQRNDHRYSRQGATPPPGLMPAATLLLWAYLAAVETQLLVVAHEGPEPFSDPGILLLALVVGYAPTRLFIWFLGDRGRLESALAVLAFFHLVWRMG